MRRSSLVGVAVVAAFLALALLPTAQATHEWGHRYMMFGRVLDSEGNPAARIPVRITVETTLPTDPWMIVPTDCNGLYYSLETSGNPSNGNGLEGGRMHIHNSAMPRNADYTLSTDYGSKTGKIRSELKFSVVNLQLDTPVPAQAECADGSRLPWTDRYVVAGHVQRDLGSERKDVQTLRIESQGVNLPEYVTVTLDTTNNGTVNQTIEIGPYGDYFAFFENVSVAQGARVTTTHEGHTRTGQTDTKYRLTEINVVIDERPGAKTLLILGGVVAVGAIGVGAFYAASALRRNIDTKRAIAGSTRKRANR